MPARDFYHDLVVKGLEQEGWKITDDPLRLTFGRRNLFVDLGAEKGILGAVRGDHLIAVEIKGFAGPSDMKELEGALGQYILYRDILKRKDPQRLLYLAIPNYAFEAVFADELGELIVEEQGLRLLVFDPNQEKSLQWIPQLETEKPSLS